MDQQPMVRVAMIGAGSMANSVHYPSLASFDDVAFAGVCDLDRELLADTADRWGIERRYTDYRKMVEEVAPDGVYAIGQPNIMFDIWVWCLQQGLNLYIEKPMGLTRHQAIVLTDLAEKRGVITQVNHQRRSAPLLVRLREECLRRGPITHAVCEFFKSEPEPRYHTRDHMMDDCTHSIDTVRWMCGGEVTGVDSRCRRIGTPDINWIGAMLHFDNGATGFVISSWTSGRRVFRVQMHAPSVYVDAEVEGTARLYADGDLDGVAYDTREVAGSEERYVYGGHRAKNREFIDSIKRGRDVTSSPFRDCVKTMDVAERILAHAALAGE
jgi:predicted dehydrogenase